MAQSYDDLHADFAAQSLWSWLNSTTRLTGMQNDFDRLFEESRARSALQRARQKVWLSPKPKEQP